MQISISAERTSSRLEPHRRGRAALAAADDAARRAARARGPAAATLAVRGGSWRPARGPPFQAGARGDSCALGLSSDRRLKAPRPTAPPARTERRSRSAQAHRAPPGVARSREGERGEPRRAARFLVHATLGQAWVSDGIRNPQCAFEVSMFMCPAVHMSTRSLRRSSSTHVPSDPPFGVVLAIARPLSRRRLSLRPQARGTPRVPARELERAGPLARDGARAGAVRDLTRFARRSCDSFKT
jgi:hypothetical protein